MQNCFQYWLYKKQHAQHTLKVVPAIFLLVSLLSLKESTYETWQVFYFNSKALLESEISGANLLILDM